MTVERSKGKTILIWVLALLVAGLFAAAGVSKLMNPEGHVESFVGWGYPPWFMYLTGFFEVGGGLLVLIPKTRIYGVLLLSVTMVGASLTHLMAGEFAAAPVPLVFLTLVGTLGWLSRKGSN